MSLHGALGCRGDAGPAPRRIPSCVPMLGLRDAGGFEEKAGLSPGWGQLPCRFPARPWAACAALGSCLFVVLVVTAAPASVVPLRSSSVFGKA